MRHLHPDSGDTVVADSFDTLAHCENVFNPRRLVPPDEARTAGLRRSWAAVRRQLRLAGAAAARVGN